MATNEDMPPSGIQILRLLEAARPKDMSVNRWCLASGVSTSFFTDLRNGREPGIWKVERLARRAGLTLSELLDGKEAPVDLTPSEQDLSDMLAGVQSEIPVSVTYADWPRVVASALRARLVRYQDAVKNGDRQWVLTSKSLASPMPPSQPPTRPISPE